MTVESVQISDITVATGFFSTIEWCCECLSIPPDGDNGANDKNDSPQLKRAKMPLIDGISDLRT